MKRKFRILFVAALSSLALSGCDWISIVDAGDGEPETVDKYYEKYDLELTGGRLINELQKMSWDKHTKWITYGQVTSYYTKTSDHDSVDAISKGSSKYESFYTGKQKSSYTSSDNREHVWPCANSSTLWTHDKPAAGSFNPHYVDHSNYVGGGSDLYHVRPANGNVNTARGSSRFVCFDDPEYSGRKSQTVTYGDGGPYEVRLLGADPTSSGGYEYADQCEPDDNVKGDVARLVLYVYMHYSESGITPSGSVKTGSKGQYEYKYSDMTGSLSLTNIMGYSTDERCKEVLKAWNKMDAPSNVEKLRNDTVQKIQGNRNPFVDYPDLVDQIFE